MIEKQVLVNENAKFPKAVFIIIVLYYAVKFCHTTIKGVAALYLVDVLEYEDVDATIFFHTYLLIGCVFSIIGGIIADSFLGKFRSIVVYSTLFAAGLLLLSLTAAPPLELPLNEFTISSFTLIAFGYGAVKPIIVVFAASQFVLPQQKKQLSLLFVFLCIAENVGAISVSFVIPVLRKDLTCFDQLTCYSLVFIVSASLLIAGTMIILITKRFYKIQKPENNVIVDVSRCVCYAVCKKLKSKEKRQHWLDYADDKYDLKLIEDIKSISSVLILLSPLFIFWSLHSAQHSLWIFQTTRMDGDIGGYVIKPDQIQLAYSAAIIVLVPFLHAYVYPFLAKYLRLNTPLRRITLGCFIAALSYYASGIVELNLEDTYAKTPVEGLAQIRIYNTLDCKVPITFDGHKSIVINELDIWQDTDIPAIGMDILTYEIDYSNCLTIESLKRTRKVMGNLQVIENQATSWAITDNGLNYKFIDHVDKSNSGDPVVRTLIYVDDNYSGSRVDLKFVHNNLFFDSFLMPKQKFIQSDFKEVLHNNYDLYLNERLVESNVPLKLGGVYTIIGRVSNSAVAAHTVTVTEPNSLHILWVLPQQVLLAIAEIMVNVLIMEFAYSQAPTSMKAILQSYWVFVSFFGNVLIIILTTSKILERKVYELFLYAVLMTISSFIFAILAIFYKYRVTADDNLENSVPKKDEKTSKRHKFISILW